MILQRTLRSGLEVNQRSSTCPFFYDTSLHNQMMISHHNWIQMMIICPINWIKNDRTAQDEHDSRGPRKKLNRSVTARYTWWDPDRRMTSKIQYIGTQPGGGYAAVTRKHSSEIWHLCIKSTSRCFLSTPAPVLHIILNLRIANFIDHF